MQFLHFNCFNLSWTVTKAKLFSRNRKKRIAVYEMKAQSSAILGDKAKRIISETNLRSTSKATSFTPSKRLEIIFDGKRKRNQGNANSGLPRCTISNCTKRREGEKIIYNLKQLIVALKHCVPMC